MLALPYLADFDYYSFSSPSKGREVWDKRAIILAWLLISHHHHLLYLLLIFDRHISTTSIIRLPIYFIRYLSGLTQ